MKILIINTFYYPNIVGGVETSIQLVAENLNKSDDVAVFCIDSFSNSLKIENVNGVKIYRGTGGSFDTKLRFTKEGSKYKKLINKFIELKNRKIKKEIQYVIDEFKPDVVHTNNIYGISTVVWKVCKDNNIPIIHTVHDYWLINPGNKFEQKNNLISKIHQMIIKRNTNYVNYIIGPSNIILNAVKRYNYFINAHFFKISNGIDIDINEIKKIIEEKIHRVDQRIEFLFVGSLFENKGISNLLKAFRLIDNNNITLNICGKGKLEQEIINIAEKDCRIKFYGMLDKEKLKEVYIKSDVMIVPSIWDEPFGLVVIEANKYGLPVIGSNKGGIAEILDTTKAGKKYNFDSIDELIENIKYFSYRENIKKYYLNIIESIESYSIDIQCEKLSKVYRKAIKNES